MLKSLVTIFGVSNDKAVKQLMPVVDVINAIEPEFERLTDVQLRSRTDEFRARIGTGEELDDLLPEAFATVREAAKRTLGQRHFDAQLLGGVALHEGKIAEMRTGEGKTLVATLAAYLNALSSEGVHVVTVNDYLARRDAQWMGSIYHMLGLSTGALQHDAASILEPSGEGDGMSGQAHRRVERREAYEADITYGTNNEFGFDYLKDNMVIDLSQRVQRKLSYAIVDEIDNILIDEARTPLIISGAAEESGKEYNRFSKLVPNFRDGVDYTIDQKHRSVSLTADGMAKIEQLLGVDNLYDADNFRLVHFAENALKAHAIFERDREYVVEGGEVVIVDEFTGRKMPGRRYSDGLHQALEAKERVKIQRETVTYATITLQNYFRLYSKLSGMTGTAATEAEEFFKIYKLEVLEVPTNLPMVRQDDTDFVFKDQKAKYDAVVDDIEERSKAGQPVLVGTTDISKSELIADKLNRRGVKHEVLNAKQHEREASIVAEAGRPGAVTVATNMAGRGTDIVLGGNPEALGISLEYWKAEHDRVVEQGGLHIIGTERHEARRIDNQLRGRSGRQGDPGSSRFYVALDDDLMRRFGGDKIKAILGWAGLDDGAPLENKMISRSIEGAQVKVEAYHFDMRKHLVEYDDVVNTHRGVIYAERDKVLRGGDLKTNIESMVEKELQEILDRHLADIAPENWDVDVLLSELSSVFELGGHLVDPQSVAQRDQAEIERLVLDQAVKRYAEQEDRLTPELMRTIERQVMLRVIDSHWVQHLTGIENLRQGIGLHAYGQRDPLVMYKKEGREMFERLLDRIQYDIVHTVFHVSFGGSDNGTAKRAKPRALKGAGGKSVMASVVGGPSRKGAARGTGNGGVPKVGRNETCPCGSGKKYKRCHGS